MDNTPHLTDDDKGEINATFEGNVVRSWSYSVSDRSAVMAKAREYAEGWHNATRVTESRAIAAEEKLNLANTGANNVKLFPGSSREITPHAIAEQVNRSIADILAGNFELLDDEAQDQTA